jgi:hypothetical protein
VRVRVCGDDRARLELLVRDLLAVAADLGRIGDRIRVVLVEQRPFPLAREGERLVVVGAPARERLQDDLAGLTAGLASGGAETLRPLELARVAGRAVQRRLGPLGVEDLQAPTLSLEQPPAAAFEALRGGDDLRLKVRHRSGEPSIEIGRIHVHSLWRMWIPWITSGR